MDTETNIFEQGASLVVRWKAEDGWPILYMSKGITMFGYTQEEFSSGKVTWNDLTYPADIPRLKKEFAEFLKNGADEFDQEYRIRTRSGDIRWVLDKTVILREQDRPSILHSVLVDITAIKNREECKTKYTENLEEMRNSLSKANKILYLQEKVVDCLCGYDDSLSFSDILKLMCSELKLNSIFAYICNGKQVEQLEGWTKPNGHGEWAMPKIIQIQDENMIGLKKWIQEHNYSFETVLCLPNELEFLSCEASLSNITNVVISGVKLSEKPWGIVCFGTRTQKIWNTEELKALSSLGKMIALVAQKYRNHRILETEIESRIFQIKEVIHRINGVEHARST